MLTHNPKLQSLIAKLWDRFWSGGISNPLAAIEQITYLLFMKRLDDLDLKRHRARRSSKRYVSRFKGTFKVPNSKTKVNKSTLRWSYFKRMKAAEMLPH